MRWIFALFVALLWAGMVSAQTSLDAFTKCETPASAATAATNTLVSEGSQLCFDFDSGFGANASGDFNIRSRAASVCLVADRGSTGGAAVVDVQFCGVDAASDNVCRDTGLTLNVSNPCDAFVSGRYRFEVTTAPTGTQDAQLVIRGY